MNPKIDKNLMKIIVLKIKIKGFNPIYDDFTTDKIFIKIIFLNIEINELNLNIRNSSPGNFL